MRSSLPSYAGTMLLGVAAATGSASAQSAPTYGVEFLGSATFVVALNEAGTCVGWTSVGSALRGWVAGPGSPVTPLPLPPGRQSSTAADVNSAGVVVGAVGSGNSPEFGGLAAAWYPDGQGGYTVVELGALPGHASSNATAVDDLGDIVGTSSAGMFSYPVLFTAPGGPQDLSATGIGTPKAVNDLRVVVDGGAKRLDLATGVVQTVGLPPPDPIHYVLAFAYDLNDAGQIAATVVMATSTDCDRKAALHTDGAGWLLLSSCGKYNEAYDVNDLGDVVFRAGVQHYVRYTGLGSYLIQDRIDDAAGTWYVQASFGSVAINDSRQIAVSASNPTTGESGIVLLTPIGEIAAFCFGDGTTATACPCSNTGAAGRGCDNSIATGGALLTGSGAPSPDTVVLAASGMLPTALHVYLQGSQEIANGTPFGDGVRCAGGELLRLVARNAVGGASQFPDPAHGDPSIRERSAALGAPIGAGETRWYQTYYRDPALAFCPAPPGDSWNVTNGVRVLWP